MQTTFELPDWAVQSRERAPAQLLLPVILHKNIFQLKMAEKKKLNCVLFAVWILFECNSSKQYYQTFTSVFVKFLFLRFSYRRSLLLCFDGVLKQWVAPRLLRATPALVPSPAGAALPLQSRSPTQPSIQPLFSGQRSSHSQERTLHQHRAEEEGEEGRENALETWWIEK